MATFLLATVLVTVFISALMTRPTQAEFLSAAKCVIGVDNCGKPTKPLTPVAPAVTPPVIPPVVGGPIIPPVVVVPPPDDPVIGLLTVTPELAGGTKNVVTVDATLTDTDLASYRITVNGEPVDAKDITGTSYAVNFVWTIDTAAVSGYYTIIVYAKDVAGHEVSVTKDVKVDNTAPVVTITGGDIIKAGPITPTVTATDDTTVSSYRWVAGNDNSAALTYDITAKEPTFSPTVEADYLFYLYVTDELGNVSAQGTAFTFSLKSVLLPIEPLAPLADLSAQLLTDTPAAPTIISSTNDSTTADTATTNSDAAVLGNAISASPMPAPIARVATLASTNQGWSIFGILWYWWAGIVAVLFGAWTFIKKRFDVSTSQIS